jgi:proline dehydrogenase
VHTILDYSVEGKETEDDFDRTTDEIIDTQERAAIDDAIPFNVFKLTGIARFALLEKVSSGEKLTEGEKQEFEMVRERVERICKKAAEVDRSVMMDAEESWIQPVMDDLMLEMMKKYNKEKAIVYNTYQMYRHDRLNALKEMHAAAVKDDFCLGVKLVRGAYMEKERKRASEMNYVSPIQVDKASSDKDYDAALLFIAKNIDRIAVCVGSHNEKSSMYMTELMKEHNISKNSTQVYFSQLLGMSDHISFNLSSAGSLDELSKYITAIRLAFLFFVLLFNSFVTLKSSELDMFFISESPFTTSLTSFKSLPISSVA